MNRPPLRPGEGRSERVTVRVRVTSLATIEATAARLRLSRSEVLRRALAAGLPLVTDAPAQPTQVKAVPSGTGVGASRAVDHQHRAVGKLGMQRCSICGAAL